jgi:hypothetical protein
MTTLRYNTPESLEAACRDLVRVQRTSLGFEVQLPVIYPNGDLVAVVVTQEGGQTIVHDGGFAAMTLATAGVAITKKMKARMLALSNHYGCEFTNDRMLKVAKEDDLPLVVAVVANASRTIADQMLQTHAQPLFSFRQEVIDRVKEFVGAKRVRENEAVSGKSGTQYQIGAVVLDKELRSPAAYVEAVKDAEGVNKRFREFYDISQLFLSPEPDRIIMYDDKAHLRQGDLIVLQDVCNVVRFSDAERRFRQIADG